MQTQKTSYMPKNPCLRQHIEFLLIIEINILNTKFDHFNFCITKSYKIIINIKNKQYRTKSQIKIYKTGHTKSYGYLCILVVYKSVFIGLAVFRSIFFDSNSLGK